MKNKNRYLPWLLILLAILVIAAVPSFTDFNPTQFDVTGNKVSLKNPLNATNTVIQNITNNNFYSTNVTTVNLTVQSNVVFRGRTTMNNVTVTNLTIIGGTTNLGLIPNTVMKVDANDAEASIPNGSGMLTNNGSGVFGWAVIGGAGLTIVTNFYFYTTNLYVNNSVVSNYFVTNVFNNVLVSNWFNTNIFVTNQYSQFYSTNVVNNNSYISNFYQTNIIQNTYNSNYFATNIFVTTVTNATVAIWTNSAGNIRIVDNTLYYKVDATPKLTVGSVDNDYDPGIYNLTVGHDYLADTFNLPSSGTSLIFENTSDPSFSNDCFSSFSYQIDPIDNFQNGAVTWAQITHHAGVGGYWSEGFSDLRSTFLRHESYVTNSGIGISVKMNLDPVNFTTTEPFVYSNSIYGKLFSIDVNGQPRTIKGVTYDWPAANAFGVMTNNGSGNLGWSIAPVLNGVNITNIAGSTAQVWTNDTNVLYPVSSNISAIYLERGMNPRGAFSIDLMTRHSFSGAIAGADESVLIGGSDNEVDTNCDFSGIFAGSGNFIGSPGVGSTFSGIFAGSNNQIDNGGNGNFIGGGTGNLIFSSGGNQAIIGANASKIYGDPDNAIIGGADSKIGPNSGFTILLGADTCTVSNVAGSDYFVILSGYKNFIDKPTSSASYSYILGGHDNKTAASSSWAIGNTLTNQTASSVDIGFADNKKITVDANNLVFVGTMAPKMTNGAVNDYTLRSDASGVGSWKSRGLNLTNTWTGPTNTLDVSTPDQYYNTLVPVNVTNISGLASGYSASCQLNVFNVSSTNITVLFPANTIQNNGATGGVTITNGHMRTMWFKVAPGVMTNEIDQSW